jgi:hypothetical protein
MIESPIVNARRCIAARRLDISVNSAIGISAGITKL